MTLKNLGTETWTPTNGYRLSYTLYNSAGVRVASEPVWTTMPSNVAPNASVTVNAKVQHVPAGDYVMHWGMFDGTSSFYAQGVPVMPVKLTIPDAPPAVTGVFPPSGYLASTLTQQLSLSAYDPDNTSVLYDFKICKASDSGSCVDSGSITTPYWTPPASELVWNTAYTWTGKATSGGATTTVGPVGLTTSVPQPVIIQHLAVNTGSQAFDPQVGNYTTSATDAGVAGPALSVVRTYNSLDPRHVYRSIAGNRLVVTGQVTTGTVPENAVPRPLCLPSGTNPLSPRSEGLRPRTPRGLGSEQTSSIRRRRLRARPIS